jgi:hypothetical protein
VGLSRAEARQFSDARFHFVNPIQLIGGEKISQREAAKAMFRNSDRLGNSVVTASHLRPAIRFRRTILQPTPVLFVPSLPSQEPRRTG